MPIQPMTFQPLSYEQNNPFWTGVKSGQDVFTNYLGQQKQTLANQAAKAQLPYVAPSAEAQLQAQKLANALQQNTLNYAPQMSQADLNIKKAQPGLIYAQTGEAGARTGLINQQSKYLPLETLIKAQQANQSSNRFGAAYSLSKTLSQMPSASRAAWIAENQGEYNQMLAEIANGTNQQQSYITPQVMQKYFPDMVQAQPQQAAAQQQQTQQASQMSPVSQMQQQIPVNASGQIPDYMMPTDSGTTVSPQTQQILPQQMPAQPMQQQPQQVAQQKPFFAQPTPEMNARIKLASQMSANQALTTSATRRQMEGALQVEQIVNDPEIKRQVVSAAQYAGAAGKGKQAISALSQTNPKAYEDYLTFKNQTMVLLQNRIKTLDQMGSTDSQREELQGLYDKTMDSFLSNDSQFVDQFNRLTKGLDIVAQSVQKSATPVFNVNRLQEANPISNPYSPPMGSSAQAQSLADALPVQQQGGVPDGTVRTVGDQKFIKRGGAWYPQ